MFEATLRILESDGFDGLTTNRIAAVAGVSVGTLYQYFPDKTALLVALVKREVKTTFERLEALRVHPPEHSAATPLPGPEGPGPKGTDPHAIDQSPLSQQVRAAVRVLLSALDGRLHARRSLLQALAGSGQAHLIDDEIMIHGLQFLTGAFSTGTLRAGEEAPTNPSRKLDDIEAFVLARAVSGALRAGLLRDERLLQDARFEAALCRLIVGFLEQPQRARVALS